MADLSPEPPTESKLARALRRALLNTITVGAVSDTKVSHLCQEVRQIIADELTRAKADTVTVHVLGEDDQRGKDQALGFGLGWDRARSEVLMPTRMFTD